MGKQIEVRWEVLQQDEEWAAGDESAGPQMTAKSAQKKNAVYSLLLATTLACLLLVSLWTDEPAQENRIIPATNSAIYTQSVVSAAIPRAAYPKAPLDYWEEKFFVEEVEGRTFTQTPRQYWEDRFFQQEVEGR
jgi:hypothetical protein